MIVERGNCSFLAKAWAVQTAGGGAMLLYDNQPGCVDLGFDSNDPLVKNISIVAISLSQDTGLKLKEGLGE